MAGHGSGVLRPETLKRYEDELIKRLTDAGGSKVIGTQNRYVNKAMFSLERKGIVRLGKFWPRDCVRDVELVAARRE